MMSRPTIGPLLDAGPGPSATKDVDVTDSSIDSPRRYEKRPEELQQPISSVVTELRELINRQDQLLELMRKLLQLQNPLSQEDGELRPDDSDPNHPNLGIPTRDEVDDNERFAKSFHADVTLDSEKLKETLEETVNLFLTAFQTEGLGFYCTSFEDPIPLTKLSVWETGSRVADASPWGVHGKPILLFKGLGDNYPELINMQWGMFGEQGSGRKAIEATKLAEVLRSRWRESLLIINEENPCNYEFNLLNYDIDRYPKYLYGKVYSKILSCVNDSANSFNLVA
jgi:hypothetical protein